MTQYVYFSPTFLVLLGILILVILLQLVQSMRVLNAYRDLFDQMCEPKEEQIGFRSETAMETDDLEYEPEEYLPPGPSIYEQTQGKKQ